MAEETLQLLLPEGYFVAHEQSTDTASILEFLPEGQSLDDWSRMVTVTRSALGHPAPARAITATLAQSMLNTCESLSARVVQESAQNGYETVTLLTHCPQSVMDASVSESAIIKVIAGAQTAHTVQFAWRAALAGEDVFQGWLGWSEAQILCDGDLPAHPCAAPDPQ